VNFYDFHIGDYASRTAHLEPLEDLAYRRMLDLYYIREEALPADLAEVARLIRLRGQDDLIAAVLAEFFTLTDKGWTHAKCEAVIAVAVDKREKAQASASKRWDSERTANAMRTHSECNATPEKAECERNAPSPTTQSHYPKKKTSASRPPDGVSASVWQDFLRTRKTKVTETALDGIRKQAGLAGISLEDALRECCARGWQSFKADWLQPSGRPAAIFKPEPPLTPEQLAANAANAKRAKQTLSGVPFV
jgi:uncharacterized protein YdaU (DUF1376 family)